MQHKTAHKCKTSDSITESSFETFEQMTTEKGGMKAEGYAGKGWG